MSTCATFLFAAATQVIALYPDHAEILHIDNYHPTQHMGAFIWYCNGYPLATGISAGRLTMEPK